MDGLTLDMEPVWDEIDKARHRVESCLHEAGVDRDATNAITMVVCELAENATKYGVFDARAPRIGIDVQLRRDAIVVEVRNPVGVTDDGHLMRLDRTVQWIRGYQDPFEAYLERLREVSGQSLDAHESGLGLVRIAYEGQAVLDFYVNDQNILAVSAIHRRADGAIRGRR